MNGYDVSVERGNNNNNNNNNSKSYSSIDIGAQGGDVNHNIEFTNSRIAIARVMNRRQTYSIVTIVLGKIALEK